MEVSVNVGYFGPHISSEKSLIKELDEISKYLPTNGETLIKINLSDKNNNLSFVLENRRNIDRKTLNLIRNKQISAIIS